VAHIRGQLAPFVSAINYEWTGHRLDFTVTALHQTVNGRIEIEEALVRVELGLPLLLRIFSAGIIGGIRTEGSLLLNGPAKP
jgi:Putative polyhydroxyalkanoic acid system protein (PHA_gran_rgn)